MALGILPLTRIFHSKNNQTREGKPPPSRSLRGSFRRVKTQVTQLASLSSSTLVAVATPAPPKTPVEIVRRSPRCPEPSISSKAKSPLQQKPLPVLPPVPVPVNLEREGSELSYMEEEPTPTQLHVPQENVQEPNEIIPQESTPTTPPENDEIAPEPAPVESTPRQEQGHRHRDEPWANPRYVLVPKSELKSSKSAPERKKLGCRVLYGDGASIRQVVTAFESQYILLSNIPPSASYADIATLAERFGDLEMLTTTPATQTTTSEQEAGDNGGDGVRIIVARIKYANPAHAIEAVRSLDGTSFQTHTLSARFDVREVEDGTSVLRSTKVKISWDLPRSSVRVLYSESSVAQEQVRRLNGGILNGRPISASLLDPVGAEQVYFPIEIRGLPPDIGREDLRLFCQGEYVSQGIRTYDFGFAIREIRSMFSQFTTLEALEFLPLDPQKPRATALAHFSVPETAKHVVEKFNETTHEFLDGACLDVQLIHCIKYIVPLALFKVIKPDIDALQQEANCSFRCYSADKPFSSLDRAVILIYGPDPKDLGRTKVAVETLLSGELFATDGQGEWDDYFATIEGTFFLRVLCARTGVFIKCDARLRTIRLFGSPASKDAAKSVLSGWMAKMASRRLTVHVDKAQMRALVSGKLQDLVRDVGEANIALDVSRRTLVICAEDDELLDNLREAIVPVQSEELRPQTAMDEELCPVCFCEAAYPIKLPCGHQYCKDCLRHLLRSASTSTSITSVKCVSDVHEKRTEEEDYDAAEDNETQVKRCDAEVPYTVIRDLLSPGEEDRLLESTFLSHVHSRPDEFHYCPTPDCQTVYRSQKKEGSILRCPSCLNRICASCRVQSHDGQLCTEYQEQLSDEAYRRWREQNDVKSCPTCKADLEKNGGCNHMTCSQCSTHMCWVCMKVFNDADGPEGVYAHMRGVHGGHF